MIGGHRCGREYFEGSQVPTSAVKCVVADFTALVRIVARNLATPEYDVGIGIAWSGGAPLMFGSTDALGREYAGASAPLHHR